MESISMPYGEDSEDSEKKVYMTLSLAKYPFLKNQKVGTSGEANFKGEIEKSENQEKDDSTHHTVSFHDLNNTKSGGRV